VLNKRNRIIGKLKATFWVRTHKFGVKIPKSVEEAKRFDEDNGDTLWWDAICKEMKNVRPVFEVWEKPTSGRQDGVTGRLPWSNDRKEMTLADGENCWTMLPEQYVKAVVANVEEDLAKQGRRLPPKCVTRFSSNYAPWLEDSQELKAVGVQRLQELIGQLRWAVEIGRVDILLETSLLSSYLAMPRLGHLFIYLVT
jgi:hypothetical protein